MGRKNPGLTKEEYIKLGEELVVMRQRLSAILIQLSKAYPKATYFADQAYKAVDHLRCEFDNLVLAEHSVDESVEKNRDIINEKLSQGGESMFRKTKKAIIFFVIFSFMLFDFSIQTAKGEIIDSQTAFAIAKHEDSRARISAFLKRQDVQIAMVQHGVNPDEAQKRVSCLSDDEVLKVARKIEQLPAGGDGIGAVVGAAVFIFVVLLITDLLGLTHVFSFVNR